MNGKDLNTQDALVWLQHKSSCNAGETSYLGSDLVVISLQECPYAPNNCDEDKTHQIPCIKTLTSCDSVTHDRILETIKSSLSPRHLLIADIAMGEPPSSKGTPAASKFYGYIRLMIFAKADLVSQLEISYNTNNIPLLIPIIAPAGRKRGLSTASIYSRHHSSDKGGVCVAFPSLNILICSIHLAGTNAYNTAESHFDAIRFRELGFIAEKCQKVISKYSQCHSGFDGDLSKFHPIICGDLNFRVEVCSNPKEKSRRGKDFKAVQSVLEENNLESLRKLFFSHDRLVQLLRYVNSEVKGTTKKGERESKNETVFHHLTKEAKILLNVVDVFMEKHKDKNKGMTFPTFTFVTEDEGNQSSSSMRPRKYSDKRTPGWPDRILISKSLIEKGYTLDTSGAHHCITTSDHVPIFASISAS